MQKNEYLLLTQHIKINSVWITNLKVRVKATLDCKEIQPVHPQGDQSLVFIGRTDAEAETPVLWPLYVKS